MKILEKKDWSWLHVCTCSLCQTKFEATLSDVKLYSSLINNVEWAVYSLICPVCNTVNQIEHEHDLSDGVGTSLFSEYQKYLIRNDKAKEVEDSNKK
jgi:hypothetical protein